MKFALPIILAILFCLSLVMGRALRRLPLTELKRLAFADRKSSAEPIYKLAKYGVVAFIWTWLIGTVSLAGLLYLAYRSSWLVGASITLAVAALATIWHPVHQAQGWAWRLAGLTATPLTGLLNLTKPLNQQLNRWFSRFQPVETIAELYIKKDLQELLSRQGQLHHNRISNKDLHRASQALTFADQTVGKVMVPAKDIHWVKASEPIGPSIMDELHKTSQTRFPVVKSKSSKAKPEILGALYIGDLLNNLAESGTISRIMQPGTAYINESASLELALNVCLKSGQQLLIAVNDRSDITGLLTIETVLDSALGPISGSDYNGFNDPRLAADYTPDEQADDQSGAEVLK